ncbi:MAG: hypothetical protein KF784_01745 [Fimbriimonadaceae bacterium]|nr:hypothetical protein [Fimbriimonadaceae bacterium]
MSIRIKSILALTALVMSIALVGCGDGSGGGSTMPDNDQIRKENPTSERPSLSAGGETGGATPNTQLGKE